MHCFHKLVGFEWLTGAHRYKGRYKMVAMTSFTRAKNGDWFSRKAIPADVRDAYAKAHGVAREERFRLPSTVSQAKATAEFRDWDATISSRIEQLRAARDGGAIDLTQRQISALSGEWYGWFVGQHEDNPGEAATWDSLHEDLMEVYARFHSPFEDDDDEGEGLSPIVRRHVHAKIVEIGRVASFLAEKALKLSDASEGAFFDVLRRELVLALALLRRRAEGDYSPDRNVERYARTDSVASARPVKLAGLNCWQAFEKWVAERQPAPATVTRWRAVFLHLNQHFAGRDVATITDDEAVAWKDAILQDGERSPQVANDVWLRSTITIFNWLKANKKIPENVFAGLRIAVGRKRLVREKEFTGDEWKAILRASLVPPPKRLKPQKAAARRWVPWLCAYTGSRPGEMTQLRGASVIELDGIWTIEITPEDGAVKGGSYRRVPIHEHLIEQGFLEFVKRSGPGPLFYDAAETRTSATADPLKPVRPPYVVARQKLAEWVRDDVGIKDTGVRPNHAWRHTFKRMAARAGMERRFRFAFCGHEDGDVGDEYETPTLQDMAEELKKFPRYEV